MDSRTLAGVVRVADTGLLAKDALHLLSSGKFIDELVEIADFLHEWIGNVLHSHPTYEPTDKADIRVQSGRLVKEGLEGDASVNDLLEPRASVTREPGDDLVQLLFRSSLLCHLLYVERINASERHGEDSRFHAHADLYRGG